MKRFFSLVIFAGLLGLGINLSAQQSPSTTQDQAGAQQQTPSSTDPSGAAQDTTTSQQPVDAQSQQAARSFEGFSPSLVSESDKNNGDLVLLFSLHLPSPPTPADTARKVYVPDDAIIGRKKRAKPRDHDHSHTRGLLRLWLGVIIEGLLSLGKETMIPFARSAP
jgi:hypothetical protein